MAKKSNEYFDTFARMMGLACDAAVFLQEALEKYDPVKLPELMRSLHEIEHAGDEEKHRMMKRLAKEFITPIEREDIIQLVNEIDEVIDLVEDLLIRMYMYNIQEIRPAALTFADVIARCCVALNTAMKEFPNFRKSVPLQEAIVEVNTLEEEGDALYIESVHELFAENGDPVKTTAWNAVFDSFEECCDACEDVADVLESVIMNNS